MKAIDVRWNCYAYFYTTCFNSANRDCVEESKDWFLDCNNLYDYKPTLILNILNIRNNA